MDPTIRLVLVRFIDQEIDLETASVLLHLQVLEFVLGEFL